MLTMARFTLINADNDQVYSNWRWSWSGLLLQSDGSEQDWGIKPESTILPYDDTEVNMILIMIISFSWHDD